MQVMTNTTLGKKIKLARTNKELTQQELAACVGVTKQAITNYETGKRKPKQGTLLKIARVLAVSLDYLFNTQSGTPEALQELNNISNKIDKNDMKTKLVPVFSAAGAGRGHITQDNAIYKMPTFAGDYGVIVQGDSMAPRINTGAIVFVREVNGFEELKRGEVVVVRINGDEATVKYWDVEPGQGVVLRSENKEFTPKFVPFEQFRTNEAAVLGRVVGVYNTKVPNYFE